MSHFGSRRLLVLHRAPRVCLRVALCGITCALAVNLVRTLVARGDAPSLPSDLAWLAGQLPPDFQLDFIRLPSRDTDAPERVALRGESRLLVGVPRRWNSKDSPKRDSSGRIDGSCNYRCGAVGAAQLRAMWRARPLETLTRLTRVRPNETIEDLWEFWKNELLMRGLPDDVYPPLPRSPYPDRSEVWLHAYGNDYFFGTHATELDPVARAWFAAMEHLPLTEHACPRLQFGQCRAAQPDQPLEFRILKYAPEDVRVARIAEALRASLKDCALTRTSRRRFRAVDVVYPLSFAITPLGRIEHVTGLSPAMLACMRKSFADFRTEPAEYTGPVGLDVEVADNDLRPRRVP